MNMSPIARASSALCLALFALGGCAQIQSSAGLTPEQGAQPTSKATAVGYNIGGFGPKRPDSGFGSNGNVIGGGSTGVFGTTDPITVDNAGPFPNNTPTVDNSLSDFSAADQALLEGTGLDLSNEAALASTITFPDGSNTPAFFDADIGPTVYFGTNSSTNAVRANITSRLAKAVPVPCAATLQRSASQPIESAKYRSGKNALRF